MRIAQLQNQHHLRFLSQCLPPDYFDIDDGDDNLFDFDDEVDPFSAPQIPSHTMFDTDSETDTDSDNATQNQTPGGPSCGGDSRPIQIERTRRLRRALVGNIADKVFTVLSCMDSVGLNLPLR